VPKSKPVEAPIVVEPLYPAPATIDPPAATDRDLEAKVPVASLRMVPDPSIEAAAGFAPDPPAAKAEAYVPEAE
jgi:hypothetical protein